MGHRDDDSHVTDDRGLRKPQTLVCSWRNLGRFLIIWSAFFTLFLTILSWHHAPAPETLFLRREPLLESLQTLNATTLEKPRFTTKYPMYYINRDVDVQQRQYMEQVFSKCGSLRRRTAVDGSNLTRLAEVTVMEELSSVEGKCCDLANTVRTTSKTIALTVSHFRAIKESYEDGADVALIMEDDVSDILVPFWTTTLEGVVDELDMKDPEWGLLRLQYTPSDNNYNRIRPWFENPTLFRDGKRLLFGTVAQLMSRRGMKEILDKYWDEDRQKWHCPKTCVADVVLPTSISKVYAVQPPMFTVLVTEGDRGLRQGLKHADNRMYHLQSILLSLQWNIEAYELRKGGGSSLVKASWSPRIPP